MGFFLSTYYKRAIECALFSRSIAVARVPIIAPLPPLPTYLPTHPPATLSYYRRSKLAIGVVAR